MTGLLALQNSGSKYFVVLFCLLVFFVFFRGGGGDGDVHKCHTALT